MGMPMSQYSHSGRVLASTQLRSPLLTPSDRRPPAISREILSQSPQVASRQAPRSFQRSTVRAAEARTRSLNMMTAFGTLSARSLGLVALAGAVAPPTFLVVSIVENCYANKGTLTTVW